MSDRIIAATTISGQTALVGLIGWPVSHSVSPAMHNAAFDYLGLDWRYVPLPVNPEPAGSVGEAVRGLRALGLRGANVTVPHKQAVIPSLDQLSPAAQAIGAVNTIVVRADGQLYGDNTDAPGFVADLRQHGIEPEGLHVVVLGAGGSARAVVYGLAMAGVARIAVLNRTIERAQELVQALRPHCAHSRLSAHQLPDAISQLAPHADLIVNCTSVGMTPAVEAMPWDTPAAFGSGQTVYDLIYNPPVTRLLKTAEQDGARAIGGLGMLIWQGALAFESWTGRPAPIDVMRSAASTHFAVAARKRREPGPAIAIRRVEAGNAAPGDAIAISALHALLQRMHADAHPDFFKQPSPTIFPPDYVCELIAKPETVMLVAEIDGKVVGYLYGDTSPTLETNATYGFARFFIHHICVAPEAQGRGAGKALVQAARAYAQTHQIGTLALATWDFNRRARRFFEAQGFVNYNYRMWIKGV
jgi:shikimate dehydrogenase